MPTTMVCPIDGCVPPDNGTNTGPANNALNVGSDVVVTASTVIGSTVGTSLIIGTGANFAAGNYVSIPTRGEIMKLVSLSTNTWTVLRAQLGTVASAAIAVGDVILSGVDVNGNPAHCPLCGSAMQVANPATVTTQTGVAIGSQHPLESRAVYAVGVAGPINAVGMPEGQGTSYATGAKFSVQPILQHAFSVLKRGDQTVTAETVNGTVGP